jgi:hypothetical protein
MERWKKVDGFPWYEISDQGKLRSSKTSITKTVSGTKHAKGYVVYTLTDNAGKKHRKLAHRLVAIAFLFNADERLTDVCHNDGVPDNNLHTNLRWDTHQNNQLDMLRHGTAQTGEKSCTAKLTLEQVEDIKKRVAEGPRGTARKLAFECGISVAQISRIVNGKRWNNV